MIIMINDFDIQKDIFIEINDRPIDISKDAIDALKKAMRLSSVFRASITSKNDIFGILKLFNDYIIPGVAKFLKKNDVTLGDSIYTEEMYICFHYYNVSSIIRSMATGKNYEMAVIFDNVITKIIQGTFKERDLEKLGAMFDYFDMPFDKTMTNISLVVTRFIDNIVSGYISSEHIHIAPSRLYGHLYNIVINSINPLRISDACITDILSDDETAVSDCVDADMMNV